MPFIIIHCDVVNVHTDDATVVACARGDSCNLMSVADAKALEANALQSVEAVKGETDVVNALTPTLATMAESIRSLQAQKAVSLLYQLPSVVTLFR